MTLFNEHLQVKISGQKSLLCDSICHTTAFFFFFSIFSFKFILVGAEKAEGKYTGMGSRCMMSKTQKLNKKKVKKNISTGIHLYGLKLASNAALNRLLMLIWHYFINFENQKWTCFIRLFKD